MTPSPAAAAPAADSTEASAAAPPPASLTFDVGGGWCFGWYHAPALPWRDLAVVLCSPVGHEATCSYPTQVQLATALARAGFPVLRFDYPGTGDAGDDALPPGRVEAWLAGAEAAVAQVRARSQARQVALLGIRLGATLAVETAARLGGVDSLLLWAPCPTGKAFVRELRAAGVQEADGTLHAMGHAHAAETVEQLLALDATRPQCRPAQRVLVVGRDDLPGEGPLPKALRALGAEVEHRVLPGYAAMVDEPRAGVLDAPTLQAVAGWLAASPAAGVRQDPAPAPVEQLQWRSTGAVRETVVRAGPGASLVGVLAEPAGGTGQDRRGQTGVLLLNVGGNHRVGPHRIYTSIARSLANNGYPVLRLDLGGIGDSPPAPGRPWADLYAKTSTQDVRAAIDALAQRGCRDVVLMGICSGSYVAFQTALVDERVGGIVLMNSRLLEWTPGRAGDRWQDSMQQYAKSSDHYRRALFKPAVWRRVLRGQVNVRLIARRFLALAAARLRRWLAFGRAEEPLLAKMQRLCARGTDVLMLVADADDGRDYVEFHFGRDGRRLQGAPRFRMAYVPDADHTFSRPGNQEIVLPLLLRYLDARLPAQPGVQAGGEADAWLSPMRPSA
ncbi:MAG TPA: alpha/beta fold hydrolase [Ramlibacter sp.]|jgi:alpha-beta hydrolase superfamily lysophospholipase|uniref:alpha/beta fold hydrolase n=1 Tax=Ramlibacter sp. TaxID=1917967 RepID=UPI002D685DF8|nr:alpha/beta fold hydrolase [Ramlibacter sp.]HZY19056.1 alpha/beta fold hydrolase [Ramlibacter sp.]